MHRWIHLVMAKSIISKLQCTHHTKQQRSFNMAASTFASSGRRACAGHVHLRTRGQRESLVMESIQTPTHNL